MIKALLLSGLLLVPKISFARAPETKGPLYRAHTLYVKDSGGENQLSKSYYGTREDQGRVEVGDRCGTLLGEKEDYKIEIQYQDSFWISFLFADDIRFFKSEEEQGYGLYMDYAVRGRRYVADFRHFGTSFLERFTYLKEEKFYRHTADTTWMENVSSLSLYPETDGSIHTLSLSLYGPMLIYSLTVDCGETPIHLENIVLNDQVGKKKYLTSRNVSSLKDDPYYPVNEASLSVPFNEQIPQSYFKRRYFPFGEQQFSVEDLNGYYRKNSYWEGEKFTLLFHTYFPNGERKRSVTFHLTAEDRKKPTLIPKSPLPVPLECPYDALSAPENFFRDYFFAYKENAFLTFSLLSEDKKPLTKPSLGSYRIYLSLSDSNANRTLYPLLLSVYDKTPPKIIPKLDEITLSKDRWLSQEELLSFFTVQDEFTPGEIKATIKEDSYTLHHDTPGEYFFSVEAQDGFQNATSKTLRIRVVEEKNVYWTAKNNFFTFYEGEVAPLEELLLSLRRQGLIPEKEYVRIEQVSGKSLSREMKPGLYELSYRLSDDEKETYQIDITVNVLAKRSGKQEGFLLSFFEDFLSFFVRLLACFTPKG